MLHYLRIHGPQLVFVGVMALMLGWALFRYSDGPG